MKKVVYYNMPGDIEYEKNLLKEWNIQDIELVQMKGNNLPEDIKEFEGLVTEYTQISEDILSKLPKLKIISLQSIGYDEIDVKAARKYGIDVTNAPGYCSEDVATHAVALLLSLVRQIPLFNHETHEGKWNPYAGSIMHRLSGKKAGLCSFGNIPQKEVSMLKGFGIQVCSFDPGRDRNYMAERGVEKCETLEQLLQISDFVFLHTPLFPETYHMIDESALSLMKKGAVLINVSRGALIDQTALEKALKSGKLSAAGLDVLEDEENRHTELFNMDNVVITPHAAFLSEDSLKQSRCMALEQLVSRLSRGTRPELTVN